MSQHPHTDKKKGLGRSEPNFRLDGRLNNQQNTQKKDCS